MKEIDQAKQFVIDDYDLTHRNTLAPSSLIVQHFYRIHDQWVVALSATEYESSWEVTYNETTKIVAINTFHQVDTSIIYN